jgi:hypothetical protein
VRKAEASQALAAQPGDMLIRITLKRLEAVQDWGNARHEREEILRDYRRKVRQPLLDEIAALKAGRS